MELTSLTKEISGNPYPGRGIVIGKSEDGKYAVSAYFIMGRSANSRNRIFEADGDGLRTKAYDEAKVEDPSLIIYSPVRVLPPYTIVTNGDQTDTIYAGMKDGKTFEESLRKRKFEPDAPNLTPRISGLLHIENGSFDYMMSILKSDNAREVSVNRFTFSYDAPIDGEGRFLHTYAEPSDPLKSFEGEPKRVDIKGNIEEFTDSLWNALNEDNKISLFVRFIDIATGKTETKIINKYN